MKPVLSFRGRWGFLSNMSPLENPLTVTCKNGTKLSFPTIEHYFQACKTLDMEDKKIIAAIALPGKVKQYSKDLVIRDDWENIKLKVMWAGLCWKFSDNNPTLKEKLLATHDAMLTEGNLWGDYYWGVNRETGEGQNFLGRLIMQRRTELKGEEDCKL